MAVFIIISQGKTRGRVEGKHAERARLFTILFSNFVESDRTLYCI